MSYMVYCVFSDSQLPGRETGPGVGGHPVFLLSKNGLGAAYSDLPPADFTPDLPRIMSYQKIVESLNREHTVIPMRYGCKFEQESEIVQFLEKHHRQYNALLGDLAGHLEMGIRILRENEEGQRREDDFPASVGLDGISPPSDSGRAYLSKRKEYFDREKRLSRENMKLAEKVREEFAGLFTKWKAEASGSPLPLLSLYFLVPRGSVEPFRKAFRRLRSEEDLKMLLSGPWPPYNFVLSEPDQGQ
jgi:hypothetical protein